MRLLDHPNVVSLKHCFFSTTEKDELYLNLVLEYVPETVHRVIKHYNKMNQRMPLIYVKLYFYQVSAWLKYSLLLSYFYLLCLYRKQEIRDTVICNPLHEIGFVFVLMQICRALAYIHNSIGVCHRDIKPQNLLVFPNSLLNAFHWQLLQLYQF